MGPVVVAQEQDRLAHPDRLAFVGVVLPVKTALAGEKVGVHLAQQLGGQRAQVGARRPADDRPEEALLGVAASRPSRAG